MINLSKSAFSIHVYKLLNKGLNFCPNPGKYNKTNYKNDINEFLRKVKLKAFFSSKQANEMEETSIEQMLKTRKKTKWEPHSNHHTVNTFCESFSNELLSTDDRQARNFQNLSKLELAALEELTKRNDIIITKADKGGAIVIQDVEEYIKEANRQLHNKEYYKKVNKDLTNMHNTHVNEAINELQSSRKISKQLADALKIDEAKTSKFYTLPKIHKSGNPGRPIVSAIDAPTSKISEFVDHNLQPHVEKLKSHIKDTTHFINKIQGRKVPPNSILVTMDVRSLYTNIPKDEGIQAVKKMMDVNNFNPTYEKSVLSDILTTFLELILSQNSFVFNGSHYLQIKGCSMGTKCAPSFANLFMGEFEENFIYNRIQDKYDAFLRFIDDIFMVWTGTRAELNAFMEEINKVHPSIKFDFQTSTTQINFLDTTVFIENNQLFTKTYTKPTDKHAYLHKTSYHPYSLKSSIIYSQVLRTKRICTKPDDYANSISKLFQSFRDRGYNDEELNTGFNKAANKNRDDLLKYKAKRKSNRIPLILTYNQQLPDIKKVIDNNWKILGVNNKLSQCFAEPPIIAYRRNKNLKDILGQTKIINGEISRNSRRSLQRCSPCHSRPDNLCCKQVLNTATFKSTKTKKEFSIYHKATCKSSFVVYLLECQKCNLQYVGKSETSMNLRINNHRKDAKNPKEDTIPASKHFNQPGHEFNQYAKFILIEQIGRNIPLEARKNVLRRREVFWIEKLHTLTPDGFNQDTNC